MKQVSSIFEHGLEGFLIILFGTYSLSLMQIVLAYHGPPAHGFWNSLTLAFVLQFEAIVLVAQTVWGFGVWLPIEALLIGIAVRFLVYHVHV